MPRYDLNDDANWAALARIFDEMFPAPAAGLPPLPHGAKCQCDTCRGGAPLMQPIHPPETDNQDNGSNKG